MLVLQIAKVRNIHAAVRRPPGLAALEVLLLLIQLITSRKENGGETQNLVEIIGSVLHCFAVRLAIKTCPENLVKYQ